MYYMSQFNSIKFQNYSRYLAAAICFSCTSLCFADSYPGSYQITTGAFNYSQPLEDKLNTTRGEYFFRKSGLYLGASDAIHKDKVTSKDSYEIDAYAGLKKELGLIGYHLGMKSYNRSIEKDVEIQELYIGGNIKDLHFSYATNDEGIYTQLNYIHEISNMSIGLHVGKTSLLIGKEFRDWSIHASKIYKGMTFNAIMTKSEDPLNSDTQLNFGVARKLSLF